MKKIIFSFCLLVLGGMSFAQANSEAKFKDISTKINTSTNILQLDQLTNEISNMITDSNANKWKVYYYAGLAQYKKAELQIKNGDFPNAVGSNAMAYKMVYSAGVTGNGSQNNHPEIKKLLGLVTRQSEILKKTK